MIARAVVILAFLLAALPAMAVLPNERLADPALEARARALSQELRCQVCQNQSIDDSNAPLAADLRRVVRERLTAGDSDAAVLQFMSARYGDYVLLKPPVRMDTWALWFGPLAILLIAAAGLVVYFRRRRDTAPAPAAPLAPDELRRVAHLLDERTKR
jgi:cytochrome c-type biogenesis protein CcmH